MSDQAAEYLSYLTDVFAPGELAEVLSKAQETLHPARLSPEDKGRLYDLFQLHDAVIDDAKLDAAVHHYADDEPHVSRATLLAVRESITTLQSAQGDALDADFGGYPVGQLLGAMVEVVDGQLN